MKNIIFSVVLLLSAASLYSADDPSIQGKLRKDITKSMEKYIDRNTIDGIYAIYDPVEGKLLKLKLKKLHSGIVKKGNYYVSCADFMDPAGSKVDLDFMVVPDGKKMKAIQAIVHKKDGKKRPYHLEN